MRVTAAAVEGLSGRGEGRVCVGVAQRRCGAARRQVRSASVFPLSAAVAALSSEHGRLTSRWPPHGVSAAALWLHPCPSEAHDPVHGSSGRAAAARRAGAAGQQCCRARCAAVTGCGLLGRARMTRMLLDCCSGTGVGGGGVGTGRRAAPRVEPGGPGPPQIRAVRAASFTCWRGQLNLVAAMPLRRLGTWGSGLRRLPMQRSRQPPLYTAAARQRFLATSADAALPAALIPPGIGSEMSRQTPRWNYCRIRQPRICTYCAE